MQIAKKDFDKIVEHVKNRILDEINCSGVINPPIIVGVCEMITLEGFLDSIQEKKQRVKKEIVINEQYKAAWNKFWSTWPTTKSVPLTEYKSGAVMKKDEKKMYEKWCAVIECKGITIEQLQYATECYLEWAYTDSKRLGRNELQFRNGMEPWFNQSIYMNYIYREMPPKNQVQKVEVEDYTFNV